MAHTHVMGLCGRRQTRGADTFALSPMGSSQLTPNMRGISHTLSNFLHVRCAVEQVTGFAQVFLGFHLRSVRPRQPEIGRAAWRGERWWVGSRQMQ
jgi:hypothetical protein